MVGSSAPPEHLELWIEGPNGEIFHISGGQHEEEEGIGLCYTPGGTNFGDVFESPFTTIYQSAAFQLGGRYTGETHDMFQFAFMINVYSTQNLNFRQSFTRFRNVLSSKTDSYLHARIQGVSHRTLTFRLQKTSGLKTDVDPNGQKFGQVMLYLVGAYPRWVEQDFTDQFTAATDTTGAAVTAPTVSAPTTATTGGTLTAATYFYKVTSLTSAGETAGSNEVSKATTGSASTVTLTWGAVTGATGYKIYRSTTTGAEHFLATVGAVTTYTDTGTATTSTVVPTVSTIPVSETGYVRVWNPTNTDCWVKWMAQGSTLNMVWILPDFSWGSDAWNRAVADAGRMIIMPGLLVGEHIKVDTDPLAFSGQVNSSLDTQIYLRMNGVQFLYPIPARTPMTLVPVQVTKAAPGNGVQLRVPLQWEHPWGGEE